MHYEFPVITNISQVRDAIKGRTEFIEADRDTHIIFNYLVNFQDTFPPVMNMDDAILRECRGLIFDKVTGKVIARRYHKFFNVGERVETLLENIKTFDWSDHVIMEKLDGSMITPFMTSDGVIRIGTKMGETDVAKNAKDFIDKRPDYQAFIEDCCTYGFTPMFEWCSRKNRIVIDYPVDRLVLTGIRSNENGGYISYTDMLAHGWAYGVEVVKIIYEDFDVAHKKLETLEKEEGYVVRFDNGHMLKIKGAWYVQLHKAMEHLTMEKDVVRLVIENKLDDIIPFLENDLKDKVDRFGKTMMWEITQYSHKLAWEIIADVDNNKSKRDFAGITIDKMDSDIRFKVFDFMVENSVVGDIVEKTRDLVMDKVLRNTSSQTKVDSVRYLFGNVKWEY